MPVVAMGRWKKGPQIEMEDKLRVLASSVSPDARRPILLVRVQINASGENTESKEEHTFENASAALAWLLQIRGGDIMSTRQAQQPTFLVDVDPAQKKELFELLSHAGDLSAAVRADVAAKFGLTCEQTEEVAKWQGRLLLATPEPAPEPEPEAAEPEPEAASELEPTDPQAGYDTHEGDYDGSQGEGCHTVSPLSQWTVHDGCYHSFADELKGLSMLVEHLREQLDALVCIPSPSAKYGSDGGGDKVQASGGDEQPLEIAKTMLLRSFHAQLISTLQRSYGRGSADGLSLRRHELDANELGEIMHWLCMQYAQTLLEYGFNADAQQAQAWVDLQREMHSITPKIAAAYTSYLRRMLRRALQVEAPGSGWSDSAAAANQETNGTSFPNDIKKLLKTIIDDAAASCSSSHILQIYQALAFALASEVDSISSGHTEVSSNATISAGKVSLASTQQTERFASLRTG